MSRSVGHTASPFPAVAARLAARFGGRFSADEIEQRLLVVHGELATDATVTAHLVTLAEHIVREQLVVQSRAASAMLGQ